MRILSIETSCDETAVSLLEITGPAEKPEIKILGNSLFSQVDLHKEYGGVYPNLAKREHQKNLPILLEKTLEEAKKKAEEIQAVYELIESIDFIAVTAGPGLEPALWVGLVFAQDLSKKWGKPVLGVNHMEGHIFSVLYGTDKSINLPALSLLVSGGHTELVYMKDFCDYEILGKTRDDAVGEAFDKVARILGLPYPGGPQISKLAAPVRGRANEFEFPRPMIHSGDLDFSFSGLKTSVLYTTQKLGELTDEIKAKIACAFEDAAIDSLISKTRQALDSKPVNTLIVGGGVSANKFLRSEAEKLVDDYPDLNVLMPSLEVAGDNSIMIGVAAYEEVIHNPEILNEAKDLIANGNLTLS